MRILNVILVVVMMFGLFACGGGGGGGSNPPPPPVVVVPPPPTNVAPTANSGPDQTVDEHTTVTLFGSGSDSDGSISSYSWGQINGLPVVLNNANTATVTFTAPDVISDEILTFILTVTDDDGASSTHMVAITVISVDDEYLFSTAIPISIGTVYRKEIDSSTDVDVFAVTTTSRGTIVITLTGLSDDLNMGLYDSEEASLGYSTNPGSSNERIEIGLSNAGVYYVAIIGSQGAISSYALEVTFGVESSDDHGGSVYTATGINQNSITSGNLEVRADEDYFKIVVSSEGTLLVSTIGSTDTYGYLIDSSGDVLVEDDESGSGHNFSLNYFVDAGTYYVRVKGRSATTSGVYFLVSSFDSVSVPVVSNPNPANGATIKYTDALGHFLSVSVLDASSCKFYYDDSAAVDNSLPGEIVGGKCEVAVAYVAGKMTKDGRNYWYVEVTNSVDTVRYPSSGSMWFDVVPAAVAEYTLEVSVNPILGGNITSDIGRINCGTEGTVCSEIYNDGNSVTLTATTHLSGYYPVWNSTECSETGEICVISMDYGRSISVSFVEEVVEVVEHTLKINVVGGGKVTIDPGGVDCKTTCSKLYKDEMYITLTAKENSGYEFTGWTGDSCWGINKTCSGRLTSSQNVTATFTKIVAPTQYKLTVTKSGSGKVTSDRGSINCGSTCFDSYDEDERVKLTAAESNGYDFSSWTGCSSTSGKTCYVTMMGAKNVKATFVEEVVAPTKPDIPEGVSATDGELGKLMISWKKVDGATKYYVFRSTSATEDYDWLVGFTDDELEMEDSEAIIGVTYYYKVRAYRDGLYSNMSDYNSGWKGIPVPTGAWATDFVPGKIQVEWNEVDLATRYYVYRSTSENGEYTKLGSYVAGASVLDEAIIYKMDYYYKIKAYINGKKSDFSAPVRGYALRAYFCNGSTLDDPEYIETDNGVTIVNGSVCNAKVLNSVHSVYFKTNYHNGVKITLKNMVRDADLIIHTTGLFGAHSIIGRSENPGTEDEYFSEMIGFGYFKTVVIEVRGIEMGGTSFTLEIDD